MNARLPAVANHPRRKSIRPNPTPAEIVRARGDMTQEVFGALVHKGFRAVQEWESGGRKMPPDTWDLIKIKQKAWELVKRGRIAPQTLLDLGIELPKGE